ncbi:MAG: hypothetical protein ACRDZQ_14165 [Acidimicrobiales bacterium]
MGTTRTEIHHLVDALPDEALDEAGRLLSRTADPMVWKLDRAPLDDEPYTAIERAEDDMARTEPTVAWSELRPELGAD